MKILITGGRGFLGKEIVKTLSKEEVSLSVLSRQEKINNLDSSINFLKGDLIKNFGLEKAFNQQNLVIHTAVNYKDAKSSISMTKKVIELCLKNQVERIIYISSQNASFKNPTSYSIAKKECEELIKTSGLKWLIIRPTLLYNDKGGPFLTNMINISRKLGLIPVLGNGNAKIQPVHINDVCQIISNILNDKNKKIITVGGQEAFTLKELAIYIKNSLNKGIIVPVPILLLRFIGIFSRGVREKIQEIYENKTIEENDKQDIYKLLGRNPRGLLTDLPLIIRNQKSGSS